MNLVWRGVSVQSTLLGLKFEHCARRAGVILDFRDKFSDITAVSGPEATSVVYVLICPNCTKRVEIDGTTTRREAVVAIAALEGFEVYER